MSSAQLLQTVPPLSVARELLIRVDGTCFTQVGDRVWTDGLPSRKEFDNAEAGIALIDNGGAPDRTVNGIYIEGVFRLRLWPGGKKVSDCWRVWNLVRRQLLGSSGVELSSTKENWRARWCWAREVEVPTVMREHPELGWPELNVLIEYSIQGIGE